MPVTTSAAAFAAPVPLLAGQRLAGLDQPILFPAGLPGFPGAKRFSLARAGKEGFALYWLVPAAQDGPKFRVYAVDEVDELYSKADQDEIFGADPRADWALFLVTRIVTSETRMSLVANPRAPILVHLPTGTARQQILRQRTLSNRIDLLTW